MTDWRVEVNDGQDILTNDDGLYDVEIVDTFNPFGDYATAFFDDLAGNLFDKFQRGTKVIFQYSNDGFTTVNDRFIGYVVNDLPRDSDGAEQLEVEAYSFDQFLRGDEVSNDQTGNTIFEALKDVIQTDVPPVEWDASLVDVEDNKELTESYQGDNVEDFLLSIRQKSAGEIFTVTENLKFKFERAEVERAPRDISNSQWIQHDLGEQGGETKNQVVVSYNDGNESVIVDNTEDQLNIQDNLGAVGPGQQGESITLPDITNVEDAISAGEQFLQGRKNTLTGTVTTFDLIDAEPSQVLGVTIDSRGIDTDFRIAENKIRWRNETNELTLVEKKGADDDILIAQSKTLDRVENRPRDNSVVADKTTDTDIECEISVSGNVDGVAFDTAIITNELRNKIRDAWINGTTISVFKDLAVGDGAERPVRSDSSLQNQTESVGPSKILPDAVTARYTGSFTVDNINEIGLLDINGTLLAAARLNSEVDGGGSATFELTVNDQSDKTKSVITTDGQTATRDIIADNSPNFTNTYEFGSDSTAVAESDTALTTVATNELDNITIQSASNNSEFNSILSLASNVAVVVQNNQTELAQSAFVEESENTSGPNNNVSRTDFSDGSGNRHISGTGVEENITIDLDYDVSNLKIALRSEVTDKKDYEIFVVNDGVGGSFITDFTVTDPLEWDFESLGSFSAGQHTIQLKLNESLVGTASTIDTDVIAIYDGDFSYNFDNSLNTSSGYLDGPELYPGGETFTFDTASSTVPIRSSTVTQSYQDSDVSNNQSLSITPDGTTFNNSNSGTVTYGPERVVDVDVSNTLSRYPLGTNPQSATPRFGYKGQAIDSHDLSVDIRALQANNIGEVLVRSFVDESTATSSTFAEAGQLSGSTLLTRALLPEFDKKSNQQVISNEKLRWVND